MARDLLIGNAFALSAFETAIQCDDEVVGGIYTGSLGRGVADRYSDLDIELWVVDRAFADAPRVLRRLMAYLGTVHFMYDRGEAFTTGFVGPDWQRVDLALHQQAEMQPRSKYAHARIAKDVGGSLARMVALAPMETMNASWEHARAAIEEAVDSQIYHSLHNARGAVWSAMGEISFHSAELYTLLALLRGQRSFGFRYVEQLLSPAELEMLGSTWPRKPDPREVHRAGRALWHWTRHVWREAEVTLGRGLEIMVDEAELLAVVDRIHASSSHC